MNPDVTYARMESPVGPVWVAATGVGVCAIGLGDGQPDRMFEELESRVDEFVPSQNDVDPLTTALIQLDEYFSTVRQQFDLPLDLHGTTFQREVWEEVGQVPYGTTTTYSEVAKRIGRPKAARAVGAALSANLVPIVIPCHRVIGVGGKLTGYRNGIDIKAALLRMEGVLLS